MKSFRRVAFVSTIATYFLIFMGSLVRVSGAGLGCPDWPRCYGRWFPPLHVSDLPPELHATGLTVVLSWIEYINRLIGVSVGFLILATAILAFVYYRNRPRVVFPALAAVLLVAYEGWQGGRVVTSELDPLLVSIHLLLSYLIVSLLIYVTQQTYYERRNTEMEQPKYPTRALWWVGLLWVGGMLQIVLGTQVRQELEVIGRDFPMLSGLQQMAKATPWNDVHMISGTLMAVFTWFLGFSVLRLSEHPSRLVKQSLWGMMILMAAQVGIGFYFYVAGLTPVVQLFHQWTAGLFIGLTLACYFGVRYRATEVTAYGRSFGRVAVPFAVAVVILAIIAYVVVGRAEAERRSLPETSQMLSNELMPWKTA